MASRHLARSIAMQTLYEWDFYDQEPDLKSIVKRNLKEFAPGFSERDFVFQLIEGVSDNMKKLDGVITASAPEWPVDKLPIVDRNILRIGLQELLHADRKEVPPRVAINEAIELAKTYGGINSGRFVNGVLGTVYREIGEPDKKVETKADEVSSLDASKEAFREKKEEKTSSDENG